jgi:hypothetical protein
VVAVNAAIFLLPGDSLAHQVAARDRHVAATIAQVRVMDPATTVLLADPEGPGSYRLAMYYLPQYPAMAIGRDWHDKAGEFFSDRGGAPEYSLDRFAHSGALNLPLDRRALILDDAVMKSIGDPTRVLPYLYGPGYSERMYIVDLTSADPPVAWGPFIYVRGSDCPCQSHPRGAPLPRAQHS